MRKKQEQPILVLLPAMVKRYAVRYAYIKQIDNKYWHKNPLGYLNFSAYKK